MAQKRKAQNRQESPKPGSSAEEAHKVGGEGDFGAQVGTGPSRDRDYVNENTKRSDRGATQPNAFEQDGVRDHGAGGPAAGPGSSSGGDLDTDIIGVGTGGSGVASSGVVGRPPGPDDSDGSSDEFAAGGHAQGENQSDVHKVGGSKRVKGSTISRDTDVSTGDDAQGADAVSNPRARGDDSFMGEISTGEAQGDDNPLSPSSDES